MDIAATVSARELEQARAQSLAQRLTTRAQLERELEGNRGRGTARLRRLLAAEVALTRSEAEERLLSLIRKAKLPQPATNVRVPRIRPLVAKSILSSPFRTACRP